MKMEQTGLRIGKVSSIDYEKGMMQIVYPDKDNAVTSKIPYANFNNEYCMPKIGESVLVGHLSNGSSRGVVLCTMWNGKNKPEEYGKGFYRKELSKVPGAAYIRFDEESGEYLIRMPVMLLHGIDRTDLEGPEVNIAANVRTSFESPEHKVVLGSACLSGMEGQDILAEIASNVKITMNLAELEALVKKISMEAVEGMRLKAGIKMEIDAAETMDLECGKGMSMTAGQNLKMTACGDMQMEDGKFSTTLSAVLERLEALDNDKSARK